MLGFGRARSTEEFWKKVFQDEGAAKGAIPRVVIDVDLWTGKKIQFLAASSSRRPLVYREPAIATPEEDKNEHSAGWASVSVGNKRLKEEVS